MHTHTPYTQYAVAMDMDNGPDLNLVCNEGLVSVLLTSVYRLV